MKKLTFIASICVLFLFANTKVFAQTAPTQLMGTVAPSVTITGQVIDAVTKKPLAGTSVYLNGTYAGTVTDERGNFTLTAEKTNTPLVVSFIGYQTQTISNYNSKGLQVFLIPKVKALREVAINDDEMSRAKKMKMFLKEFIGSANNDCVITNPDDIWLHYNKKTAVLTAGSDKPLVIANNKLGYKVTYLLDTFRFAEDAAIGRVIYRGNYYFTEDTAGRDASTIQKILKDRDDAYFGSRMHFIRSLWAEELRYNNFMMLQPTVVGIGPRAKTEYDDKLSSKLTYKDVVKVMDGGRFQGQKYFTLTSEVSIMYQPKNRKEGISYMRQKTGYDGVLIDSNGYCGDGIGWTGRMAADRISKLLPFEFKPIDK